MNNYPLLTQQLTELCELLDLESPVDIDRRMDKMRNDAFSEALKDITENTDRFAKHKNLFENMMRSADRSDLEKYFGTQIMEMFDELFSNN